jgi:hypothetical protein
MNPADPGPFVGHPANGPRRPFALSFPRDPHLRNAEGFDKLSPNGWLRRTHLPFVLSPSTGSGQALAKDSPTRCPERPRRARAEQVCLMAENTASTRPWLARAATFLSPNGHF